MKTKWIAILCVLALVLSVGAVAFASGEASKTRGDVMEVKEPETAADYILSAFSCKKFNDKEVTDEVLQEIIQAGINAPSAINSQPWQFIVVKDETLRNGIVSGAPSLVIVAAKTPMGTTADFSAGVAAEAMYLYAQAIGLGAHMYTAPVSKVNSAAETYGLQEGYTAAVVIAFGYYDDFVDAASAASVRNEYDTFVTVLGE